MTHRFVPIATCLLIGLAVPASAAAAKRVRIKQAWAAPATLQAHLDGVVEHTVGDVTERVLYAGAYTVNLAEQDGGLSWSVADRRLVAIDSTADIVRLGLFIQLSSIWPCDIQLDRRGRVVSQDRAGCLADLADLADTLGVGDQQMVGHMLADFSVEPARGAHDLFSPFGHDLHGIGLDGTRLRLAHRAETTDGGGNYLQSTVSAWVPCGPTQPTPRCLLYEQVLDTGQTAIADVADAHQGPVADALNAATEVGSYARRSTTWLLEPDGNHVHQVKVHDVVLQGGDDAVPPQVLESRWTLTLTGW